MFFNLLCVRTPNTCTMSTFWVIVKVEGESCCYCAPFGQTPSAAYRSKDEAPKENEMQDLVRVVLYEEENIACTTQIYALNLLWDVVDCYEFPVYSLVETVFSTKEAALEYASATPADYEEDEDGNPVVYCLDVL